MKSILFFCWRIVELNKIPGFETPVVALTADVISDIGEKYTEIGLDENIIEKDIGRGDVMHILAQFESMF